MKFKKSPPLVSVAIITFNQKKFLQECIESVLMQDYDNLEIVVADDASTDGTADLLKIYSEKYPGKFIIKIAKINLGITKNSNIAHFSCSGKYIAWMGGDDLMLKGKISSQVEVMENDSSISICYHDLDVFDSDTGTMLHLYSEKNKSREGGLKNLIMYGTFNGACSTMIRRSDAPGNGFDERLPIASDWLYWVQTSYGGGRIKYIKKILGRYRRHSKNVTSSINGPAIRNMQDHLLSCSIILSEKPIFYREVKYRMAELMISMRKIESGAYYGDYLRAALSLRFRPKAVIGLLMLSLRMKF